MKYVEKNFSRHANTYDKFAIVQKKSVNILDNYLPNKNISKILELGCGTGIYSEVLSNKYPKAHIDAVDISSSMLEVASKKLANKKIKFILEDIEKDKVYEKYDLITSSSTFQWIKNYRDIFETISKNKCEHFVFSSFGPMTLWQLKEALSKFGYEINSTHPSREKILDDLKKLFPNVYSKEITVTEIYPSLMSLLMAIKYTGTRRNDSPITLLRSDVKKIEDYYFSTFKEIICSYQLMIFSAEKS